MQANPSSAGSSSNNCEVDFAKLDWNAKTLIADIKKLTDGTQQNLGETHKKCAVLFDVEKYFLDGSYAIDANRVRRELKKFTDGYVEDSVTFGRSFKTFEDSYGELDKLGCDFEKKNDLTCQSSFFLKGCEAKLNAQRCELSQLMIFLKTKSNKAVAQVTGMMRVLEKADKHVDQFICANNLHDESEDEYCKLKAATTQFFAKFNEIHWHGHANFVSLQLLSDQITAEISILSEKYNNSKC